ncbi:MAG: hypothetical protein FGM54_05705 [Chitinophagaceae bacterium]|nr:hypothetical protein [Chitinophagaceae bacterium]
MNLVHGHLLLNHFPIIGAFIGLGILLVGIWKKNETLQNTAAYLIFIIALITIPAFYTGEPAEEAIEHLSGVSHKLIHEHEEAAELAFLVMLLNGAIAFGYILLNRVKMPLAKRMPMLLLIVTAITCLLMARAGSEGGKIRHPETENNATMPASDNSLNNEEHHEHED